MACDGKTIFIFTDNQAAILPLESYHTTSKLVWECKQLLLRLGSTNNVTLAWVPGHSGVEGNELADELAKKGASSLPFGPEPTLGISYRQARKEVEIWLQMEKAKSWQGMPNTRNLKRLSIKPSRELTQKLLSLKRTEVRRIVGILTGHCHLRHHLHRIGVHKGGRNCK